MKTGKTLTELAVELERQAKSKKDYLADTRKLTMTEDGANLSLTDNGTLGITDVAHDQLANRLGIPRKYYDRMRAEQPELLAHNVNTWFNVQPETRMVRALDGKMRAFLSDRYRPLDNFDLAEAVLPKVMALDCEIKSCELTEKRMYIKVVTERITAEVKKGDVVQAGLVISNSEVGCGSVKVEPLVFRLVCLNGMIMADLAMRKFHIGRGHGDMEDGALEFYKDTTRMLDDKAFFAKVRDVVEATLDDLKFKRIVERYKVAAGNELTGDPVKHVEQLAQRYTLSEDEHSGILRHLIKGGDLTQWGLANAVTRHAQDAPDYDRATELERLGGEIIELPAAALVI